MWLNLLRVVEESHGSLENMAKPSRDDHGQTFGRYRQEIRPCGRGTIPKGKVSPSMTGMKESPYRCIGYEKL